MSEVYEHASRYLPMLFLCIITGSGQTMERDKGTRVCHTEKYAISCSTVHIAGHNISVAGSLYPCARPIYLKFQVKKSNMSKVTEYTFINRDETQRMQGWDQYLAFHCVLKHNLDYAFIKAGFLDESVQVYFVKTQIKLPRLNDCPAGGSSTSKVFPILIVAAASILVAASASALLIWWYKKRKHAKLQARELLSNMETSPHSAPYQEEPISSDVNRPSTTTVIENTVYRDSVNLDAILDPIPEEDGADCPRSQRAHRRRPKHGTKGGGRRDKRTANGSTHNGSGHNGYRCTRSEPEKLDSSLVDVSHANPTEVPRANFADFPGPGQSELIVDELNSTDNLLVTTELESSVENVSKSSEHNGLHNGLPVA